MPGGLSPLTKIYTKLRMAAERTADAAGLRKLGETRRQLAALAPRESSLGGSALALSEQAFLARFDARAIGLASPAGDGRAASAQETVTRHALLAHLGRRVSQEKGRSWPRPPDWIRDPPVQIAELGQTELVALADELLEHHFVIGVYPPRATAEGKIDWHSNPAPDMEWLWALNRHQWWCIWGLVYARAEIKDERYAEAFTSQMLDWVANHPPPEQKDEQSPAWRLMEVALRMRISWLSCFALFYDSPAFTDDAKMIMLRAIYDHARFLHLFRTGNNHYLRESNGLAYVGVTLPEFKEATVWRREALSRLSNALDEQVNADGSHFELSTGYQTLVLTEYQNTYDLLAANGLTLPGKDLAACLAKMYRVMAHLARPDGSFPHVNDGFLYWQAPRLAWAGEVLSAGGTPAEDLIYAGTAGRKGSPPESTSIGFEDAGLYVMRSDWETAPDARYLLFDAGPYGGFHGHEDKLNLEIYAYGQTFIVDPGCHNYDEADPYRAYFVSSQAHNTLLVDGKSQIRRWYRENLRPSVTANGAPHGAGPKATGPRRGQVSWITENAFDYVSASYGDGYADFSLRKPRKLDISAARRTSSGRTRSGMDVIWDVIHTRQILYVKARGQIEDVNREPGACLPDYWLIVDTIKASEPHSYQLLFHTAPGLSARAAGGPDQALGGDTIPGTGIVLGTARRAQLVLIPANPLEVRVSQQTGSTDPIQGWYSEEFGEKAPATTVIFERTTAPHETPQTAAPKTTVLATLVYPRRIGEQEKSATEPAAARAIPTIKPLSLPVDNRLAFVVSYTEGDKGAGTDYLMLPVGRASQHAKQAETPQAVQLGPCQCSSIIAGVRADASGKVIARFEGEDSE